MRVLGWATRWVAAVSVCVPLAGSGSSRTLTLEDALRAAREHHPDLVRAAAAVAASEAREDIAESALWPRVSASLGYQRTTANYASRPGAIPRNLEGGDLRSTLETFDYFSAGLWVDQLVYDFGRTTGRYRAARAEVDAQRSSGLAAESDVLLRVRAAFFQARAARALLAVAQEAVDNHDRHLTKTEGFVELGRRPAIDLAQARVDRANARVQLANAEHAWANARAELSQAMGVESDDEYEIAADPIPAQVVGEDAPLQELLAEAFAARPELRALEAGRRAAELSASAVRGDYWPRIGLSTGVTEAGSVPSALAFNWSGGVGVSWTIFEGRVTPAEEREAAARALDLRARFDAARQQVRLQVARARHAVRAAKDAYAAAGEAARYARERLQLAEGRYDAGVGSALELSDARVELTLARAQEVQSEHRLATARADLAWALGRTGP